MPELIASVDAPLPESAPRVRVLYYDDGSMRFRIYTSPLHLEECFLTGNQGQHSIIKVVPAFLCPWCGRRARTRHNLAVHIHGCSEKDRHLPKKAQAEEEPRSRWLKSEVVEGVVSGGERIHGYLPDGSLLCGTLGEDDSLPMEREIWPHKPAASFTDETENACKRCLRSWRGLPD
jgi:hypothetical protein